MENAAQGRLAGLFAARLRGRLPFVPNPYPLTFFEEYQPILYPGLKYGTAGNIWAEMLCRFGYVGVALFGVLLIVSLIGMSRLLGQAPAAAVAPIALGGVVIAFYIHRNDLNYTLVMLRQIALVFAASFGLDQIYMLWKTACPSYNPLLK